MATLTLIRGLPGSGKSTYAKRHFDCLVLENDMWHVSDGVYRWSEESLMESLDWVYGLARSVLGKGRDVCIANTFTKRRFVESYRRLAEECGARFAVVRLENRFGSVHHVPAATMKSMEEHFEDWPAEVVVKGAEGLPET